MDPRLDERERELQARARDIADAVVAGVAARVDLDNEAPREAVAGLASLLGTCVPEEYGGGAGGLLELSIVAEELGRASASIASIAVHHIVVSHLIEIAGDDSQKSDLLPPIASGERLVALAVDGGGSILQDPRAGATSTLDGSGHRLDGELAGVAGATIADLLLVPARGDGDQDAIDLFVVDASASGVRVDAQEAGLGLNGSGLATVQLDAVASGTRLAEPGSEEAFGHALDAARLGHAALCVGVSQAALEAATASASDPDNDLDSSQSVQWMLADTATETEAARLLTWYAASRPRGDEFREAAAMARLVATDAAVKATRRAVQVVPGGTSRAAGVERLYRDAKSMEVHHGASEAQRMAIARTLLPEFFEEGG